MKAFIQVSIVGSKNKKDMLNIHYYVQSTVVKILSQLLNYII